MLYILKIVYPKNDKNINCNIIYIKKNMDVIVNLNTVKVDELYDLIFHYLRLASPDTPPDVITLPDGIIDIDDKMRESSPHLYFVHNDDVGVFNSLSNLLKICVSANSLSEGAILLNILRHITEGDLTLLRRSLLSELNHLYPDRVYNGTLLPNGNYPISLIVSTIADREMDFILEYDVTAGPFLLLNTHRYNIRRFILDINIWSRDIIYKYVLSKIKR